MTQLSVGDLVVMVVQQLVARIALTEEKLGENRHSDSKYSGELKVFSPVVIGFQGS